MAAVKTAGGATEEAVAKAEELVLWGHSTQDRAE